MDYVKTFLFLKFLSINFFLILGEIIKRYGNFDCF